MSCYWAQIGTGKFDYNCGWPAASKEASRHIGPHEHDGLLVRLREASSPYGVGSLPRHRRHGRRRASPEVRLPRRLLLEAGKCKLTGRPQQTLAAAVSRSGVGLHSGARATATLLPARAGEGRYFVVEGGEELEQRVAAEVGNAEPHSQLCTTLRRGGCGGGGGPRVRTVEHLLSALEALGVDNCRVEVAGGDEVAQEWVEAIRSAGLCAAEDTRGQKLEKLAPEINEPVYLRKDECFVAAFPSSQIHITYGIDFPKVRLIVVLVNVITSNLRGIMKKYLRLGVNGFLPSWMLIYTQPRLLLQELSVYLKRVEKMRDAGLIKGGSLENALVCSMSGGWLNPPLRFEDEPCRHKVLDLIGDFSLLARNGNQGFPVAHIVAYKAGHALHTNFLRQLSGIITVDQEKLAGQC
ncbi:hypothetical protein ACP4OV_015433 [Aristida adscensionis]